MAVIEGHASTRAEAFMTLLKTSEARAIFEKHGFSVNSSDGNSTVRQQ